MKMFKILVAAAALSFGTVACDGGDKETETETETGEETGAEVSAECEAYCDTMMSTCVDGNAQFDDEADCETTCMTYPTDGADGDAGGDTLQCREYHLSVAVEDPDTHCSHAGESGDNVCVDGD